jgi:hypothetical protein
MSEWSCISTTPYAFMAWTVIFWLYCPGAVRMGTSTPCRLPNPFDVVSCPMQVSCVQSRSVLGCKVNYCPRRNSVCRRCPPWRPGSFPSAVRNATDAPPVGPVEPVVLPWRGAAGVSIASAGIANETFFAVIFSDVAWRFRVSCLGEQVNRLDGGTWCLLLHG